MRTLEFSMFKKLAPHPFIRLPVKYGGQDTGINFHKMKMKRCTLTRTKEMDEEKPMPLML